jgi:hypothetical protein
MKFIIRQWKNHGTKALGFASMIAAGFPQIDGLVATEHVKYWAAANLVLGALTVQRGITNTRNANP